MIINRRPMYRSDSTHVRTWNRLMVVALLKAGVPVHLPLSTEHEEIAAAAYREGHSALVAAKRIIESLDRSI